MASQAVMAHDASAFARPTTSGLAGKQTEPVKTLVSEDFKLALTQHWRRLGFASESDFLRECLMVAVLGEEAVVRMHSDRIRTAFGNRSEIGTGA